MEIVLLAVWILGGVIWFTDGKRTSTKWASATAFVGGMGFFAGVIDEVWIPHLIQIQSYSPALEQFLDPLGNISSFICQVGLPYCYLMFAVYSWPHRPSLWKKRAAFTALTPLLMTWYITPILPELQFHYRWMVLWVVPYILYGSYLLIKLFLRERDPIMKRSHFITIVLCVVPLLIVMVTIYILRTMNLYDVWKYNIWIIAAQFILFLVFSLKYGVLGVKIRVERHRLDTTLRALTSGADILNHSIKNEVGKIQLFAHRLESYAEASKKEALQKDVQVILHSTDHLLHMVQRIQSRMKDIILQEEPCEVLDIVFRALEEVNPLLLSKDIRVVKPENNQLRMMCDAVHLHEVLTNLLINAIEALQENGVITIDFYRSKKYLVFSIEDNGSGISKENLPYILDPFFSTKKNSSTNFGLGLSYCYNVMRKHGGLLEVHSEKDQGTTVFLYFPKEKILSS